MNALVQKDLRLSVDGLLPWALIVVGLLAGGVVLVNLPQSVAPQMTGLSSHAELFHSISMLVALTAPLVAAALAALILHGDRRHGADALMGALPIRGRARVASKMLAITIAAILPPLTATAIEALAMRFDGRVGAGSPLLSHPQPIVSFVGCAIAVGLILASAGVVRRPMQAIGIGVVYGVLAFAAGLAGHAIVIGPLLEDFRVEIESVGGIARVSHHLLLDAAARDAMTPAGIVAVSIAAFTGAVAGALGIARRLRLRHALPLAGLLLLAALIGGAVTTTATIKQTVVDKNHPVTNRVFARRATDAAIVRAIDDLRRVYEPTVERTHAASSIFSHDRLYLLQHEGRERVLRLPDAERTAHPIAAAFRRHRDLSSAEAAGYWLAISVDSSGDRLNDALTALESFPDSERIQSNFHRVVHEIHARDSIALTPPADSAWAALERYAKRLDEQHQRYAEMLNMRDGELDHPDVVAERARAVELREDVPSPEALAHFRHEAMIAHAQALVDRGHPESTRLQRVIDLLDARRRELPPWRNEESPDQ